MDALDYFVIGFVILFILTLIAYIFYGIGRDFKSAYQNHLTEQLEKAQKEIYYLKVELREAEFSREAIKNSHAHLAKLHNEQIDKIIRLQNELVENENSYQKIMCYYNNLSEYNIKTVSDALKMKLDNEGLISENEMLKERKEDLERVHCEQARALRELTSELNIKNDVISTLKKTLNSMIKEKPKFEESNKEKIESLRKIIEPIEQWINENACPHDKLIITQGNVEFTSGEFGIPLKIKD